MTGANSPIEDEDPIAVSYLGSQYHDLEDATQPRCATEGTALAGLPGVEAPAAMDIDFGGIFDGEPIFDWDLDFLSFYPATIA